MGFAPGRGMHRRNAAAGTLAGIAKRRGQFPVTARAARAIVGRMTEPRNSPARYRVAVHRAHGCYFAQVLDLPGCFSRGATEVEAVENARGAIRAYLWLAQALSGESVTVRLEISA